MSSGIKLTKDEENRIIEMYLDGEATSKIAEKMTCSPQTVANVLYRNGIPLLGERNEKRKIQKERAERLREEIRKRKEYEEKFILEEYLNGWSSSQIAERMGCNKNRVLRIIHKNGIKPSKSKGRSNWEDPVSKKSGAKKLPEKEEILKRFIYLKDEGRLINKESRKLVKENDKGYRICSFRNENSIARYPEHRLIFFLETGEQPELIDHIDGNPSNNHISNLRACSHRENQRNRFKKKETTSKYKGVRRSETKKESWMALITNEGKIIYLGSFSSEEEAALAYNEAALKYFGEFANLNKIEKH